MNVQAISENKDVILRVKVSTQTKELTEKVKQAVDEHERLKSLPWWFLPALFKRLKLRWFIMDSNEQLRVYRNQLTDLYRKQQQKQNEQYNPKRDLPF